MRYNELQDKVEKIMSESELPQDPALLNRFITETELDLLTEEYRSLVLMGGVHPVSALGMMAYKYKALDKPNKEPV